MFKFILKGSIDTIDMIEIHGMVSEETVVQIRDKFMDRLKQGAMDIILLCNNLTRIDSCGISLFIEISDNLQPRGGKLHLVACPLSVTIPMKSLGMGHFFQFYKTEEEVFTALNITSKQIQDVLQSPARTITTKTVKKQVAIRDHVRNKMILFKHNENALIKDIILYLQSTYAHFRDRELQLSWHKQVLPAQSTLAQLFQEYSYNPNEMLDIEDITPEPPNYQEMIKRGGKLYDRAVMEILLADGKLERQIIDSALSIADLNQEPLVTTLIEGNHIAEAVLLETLTQKLNIQYVELAKTKIPSSVLAFVSKENARSLCVIPVKMEEEILYVAMTNPFDAEKIAKLEKMAEHKIKALMSTEIAVKQKIEEAYKGTIKQKTEEVHVSNAPSSTPTPPVTTTARSNTSSMNAVAHSTPPTPSSSPSILTAIRPKSGQWSQPSPAVIANSASHPAVITNSASHHENGAKPVKGAPNSDRVQEESGYFEMPGLEKSNPPEMAKSSEIARSETSKSMDLDILVSNKIPSVVLKQYPVVDTLPLILSETLSILQKLQNIVASLQKWHQLFTKAKTIEEMLEAILICTSSIIAPERVISFLYEKEVLVPKGSQPPSKKGVVSIPESLLYQIIENKTSVIAKCGRENEIHIAIPLASANSLLGVVYLIFPSQSYDEDNLKLVFAMITQATVALENQILKTKIR